MSNPHLFIKHSLFHPCKLLTALFFLFALNAASGQFELGIRAGISSYDLANEGILVNNGNQQISWNIANAGYGIHGGIYTRITILGVFLEPAVIFNTNSVDYNIKQIGSSGIFNTIGSERYNYVDLPLMLGVKISMLRLQGGPVGHFFINSSSDLVDFSGYSQKFKEATYGWQAGAGLDLWKFRLDLMYEGNFSKFGNHIQIGGNPYQFATTPSRLLLSLGYRF
jgi:hypothetical protein